MSLHGKKKRRKGTLVLRPRGNKDHRRGRTWGRMNITTWKKKTKLDESVDVVRRGGKGQEYLFGTAHGAQKLLRIVAKYRIDSHGSSDGGKQAPQNSTFLIGTGEFRGGVSTIDKMVNYRCRGGGFEKEN